MSKATKGWFRFWWLVRHGFWEWGWATRKKWPEKSWLHLGMDYYDGPLFSLHLGPFFITATHTHYDREEPK